MVTYDFNISFVLEPFKLLANEWSMMNSVLYVLTTNTDQGIKKTKKREPCINMLTEIASAILIVA